MRRQPDIEHQPHVLRDRHGRTETVVYSGDLVRRDEDGYLYFVGRRDQMIKSMGFRVSPEEIEHYVMASGLVAHVAAFAVPKGDLMPQFRGRPARRRAQ